MLEEHEQVILRVMMEEKLRLPSRVQLQNDIAPAFNIDLILNMNSSNNYREYVVSSIKSSQHDLKAFKAMVPSKKTNQSRTMPNRAVSSGSTKSFKSKKDGGGDIKIEMMINNTVSDV